MVKYILNDQLIDQDKAFIHVHDLAILRGYGVFDFFRLDGSVPMFIDDHLERFFQSAARLRLIPPLSINQLKDKIIEMLCANKMANSGVRLVLTGGESPNGYDIGKPTLIVLNEPIKRDPGEFRKEGIRLTSLEYLRNIPEAKTINYIMGIYNLPELEKKDALDTIYFHEGNVLELTRANFFIINEQDQIVTAKDNILKGINRNKLLEACQDDFDIQEREMKVKELAAAKEAFITGTNRRVIPVVSIDDQIIGTGKPGPLVKRVQELFDKFVRVYITNSDPLF